jgi:flavin reductase (DIM6/NTAB) family NADH-FMN oxidoreductase RutF
MDEGALKELTWDEAVTLSSPHPYVLAACRDREGRPNAIGLGWWTICSHQPPLLAISVGVPRYSRECIDHSQEFVLCLLGEAQAQGAWLCGKQSGRNGDKLAAAGLTTIPSLKLDTPTIAESVLAWECRVRQRVVVGDHVLYVGEIVATRGRPGNHRTLFTLHYRKPIAIGPDASVSADLDFK